MNYSTFHQTKNNPGGFCKKIDELFSRFDEKPLAGASIAQVHTARLHDGREVVVKVVRPNIREQILADFALLRDVAIWATARMEQARAVHLIDVVEDYRQVMLNELDLTLEADNTTTMRNNFLHSHLMYVPEVYQASKNVMIMERIVGVPISQTHIFDELGYDRASLAEKGLTIFLPKFFGIIFFMLICTLVMCLWKPCQKVRQTQIPDISHWTALSWVSCQNKTSC